MRNRVEVNKYALHSRNAVETDFQRL